MKVSVTSLTGDAFSLNVKETDTVETLKAQIHSLRGYELDQLRINFDKK